MKIKEIEVESNEYPVILYQKIGDKYLIVYYENSNGYWEKMEYDSNGNLIYSEDATGYTYRE